MDTISRENNSYLPVAGVIVGVLALVLSGVALSGVFDHRLFVQTFGLPRALDHENGDVAAH